VLEQILPKLTGQSLFDNRPNRQGHPTAKVSHEQLFPMVVPLRAVLGGARVEATDLAALEPGDVIVLDREAEDPLRVFVGNSERFAGFPGTRGRKLALQIRDMMMMVASDLGEGTP
jgi:flagellar motor switch protein FliM